MLFPFLEILQTAPSFAKPSFLLPLLPLLLPLPLPLLPHPTLPQCALFVNLYSCILLLISHYESAAGRASWMDSIAWMSVAASSGARQWWSAVYFVVTIVGGGVWVGGCGWGVWVWVCGCGCVGVGG